MPVSLAGANLGMELTYDIAAIACNLALGLDMKEAVKKANLYVEAGIRTSVDMGLGSGPINHFHSTYTLPFAPYVYNKGYDDTVNNVH